MTLFASFLSLRWGVSRGWLGGYDDLYAYGRALTSRSPSWVRGSEIKIFASIVPYGLSQLLCAPIDRNVSDNPLTGPITAASPLPSNTGVAGFSSISVIPMLKSLVAAGGSDLHVKVGSSPRVRVDGRLRRLKSPGLKPEDTQAIFDEVIRPDLRDTFAQSHEADFAMGVSGVGRFRVNAYRARGQLGLVFRHVAAVPQSLIELGMPPVVNHLALEPRGIVLVTGPTGSGKTTTLGGMVDAINTERDVNIVTIEDPIEILHSDKRAIVNQREVHQDTADFDVALRAAMRQDPDVILVGEMRDMATVRAAIQAAETGHLVLSTLHTIDAQETINRIIDFFPPHEQQQVRLSLAASLKGIISQRLLPHVSGRGRIAASEVMLNNGRMQEAIIDPELTSTLHDMIAEGGYYGMRTFDQHLLELVRDGRVSFEDAFAISSRPQDFTVALRAEGLIA